MCDIPTGSDSSIRVMSTAPNEIIAAGCADGSVRLFDKRCAPADARIRTYSESAGYILMACLRDDCENLITGWYNLFFLALENEFEIALSQFTGMHSII